jgi:DNA-binding XRE family transcriptional regulator
MQILFFPTAMRHHTWLYGIKESEMFFYEGLGFPVVLVNVSFVKKRGIWTPAIDYNRLQKEVLLALTHKSNALTGDEVHYIRTYFEMTMEDFGKRFGAGSADVAAWEKKKAKLAKITPAIELCIRQFVEKMISFVN